MRFRFVCITVLAVLVAAFGAVASAQGGTRRDGPARNNAPSAGKSIFQSSCVVCHGETGAKVAGWKAKVRKMTAAQVQQAIRKGAKGMPGFGKTLSAQQIQSAASYAKSLAASK